MNFLWQLRANPRCVHVYMRIKTLAESLYDWENTYPKMSLDVTFIKNLKHFFMSTHSNKRPATAGKNLYNSIPEEHQTGDPNPDLPVLSLGLSWLICKRKTLDKMPHKHPWSCSCSVNTHIQWQIHTHRSRVHTHVHS